MTDSTSPTNHTIPNLCALIARGQVRHRDGMWREVILGQDGNLTLPQVNDVLDAYEAERLARVRS